MSDKGKTIVISIYAKGIYLMTARKTEVEFAVWVAFFSDCATFTKTDGTGLADYYRLDFYKKPTTGGME